MHCSSLPSQSSVLRCTKLQGALCTRAAFPSILYVHPPCTSQTICVSNLHWIPWQNVTKGAPSIKKCMQSMYVSRLRGHLHFNFFVRSTYCFRNISAFDIIPEKKMNTKNKIMEKQRHLTFAFKQFYTKTFGWNEEIFNPYIKRCSKWCSGYITNLVLK